MLEIYWTAWLNENQLNDDIFPLPQIENSLKHAINCQRVKYEQVLLQLDDFKTNLEYQFELLKDWTRVEIGSLYEGTDEFIQLAKWEHLNRTEQGFQRSSDELNSYLALIQRIEEDINGEIKQLNSIFKSNSFSLFIFNLNILGVLNFEEILNLCKINPSEYTNEILKYNEKEDQKIWKTTSFSSLTTTDFGKWSELNEYDEIQSSIKNWFDISKFWYCPTWRTKNIQEDNEIIWSACWIFKPIELYESFFTNKRYASHHDINLISKRKNLEQNLINKMYIINDATNDCFIIDENWVKKWENFVYNKITEYDLQNIINPFDIKFIPFPDLVSNNDLSANYSSIKENIHSNSYRAINEEVWNHLYFTYNWGHKLNKGSIHSKELENQSFIKIQRKIDSIIFQNLSKQLEVQLLKEKERKYKAELKRFETKNWSILKLFNLMSSSQNEKSKDEEKNIKLLKQ